MQLYKFGDKADLDNIDIIEHTVNILYDFFTKYIEVNTL